MIDVIKPDKLDSSSQINGLDYLDVPGLTKRDFKLNFYTHKEGNFQIKVFNLFNFFWTFMRKNVKWHENSAVKLIFLQQNSETLGNVFLDAEFTVRHHCKTIQNLYNF